MANGNQKDTNRLQEHVQEALVTRVPLFVVPRVFAGVSVGDCMPTLDQNDQFKGLPDMEQFFTGHALRCDPESTRIWIS